MLGENNFITKSDYVFKVLKERILNNKIEQGSDLIINKISEEFQVSAIPVREALKSLEKEGLVDMEPHKTAKVVTISLEKLHEIGVVRAGLEGYAARLAVDYINEKQINKLNENIKAMRNALNKRNSEEFNRINIKFHRYLYKIQPYTMLYDMIINAWDGGKWTGAIFTMNPERMEESLNEHIEIIETLESKEKEKIEMLVRKHRLKASRELEERILKIRNK